MKSMVMVMVLLAAWGCSDESSGDAGAQGGGQSGTTGQPSAGSSQAGGSAGTAGAGQGGATTGGMAGQGSDETVACGQCFPVEQLPSELRAQAEEALLTALDSEGLFTLVGGLKPMSTGFLSLDFAAEGGEPAEVAQARQVLAALRCGPGVTSALHVYAQVFDGKKSADGVLFGQPLFGDVVAKRPVFAELGVASGASPLEVVEAVDKEASTRRFRGYGYLFGYPDHAVDFFVQAADEEEKTGKLVARDFLAIPTFAQLTGSFTYAVPKGYTPAAVDLELKAKAADILASYQKRRAQFIGEGKAGAVALLRSWFDDGKGQCSPAHAVVEAGSGRYGLAPSCWTALKSCNPQTNEGCDSAAGWACDLSEDGVQCFEPPSASQPGEACHSSKGPFCAGGAHCDGGVCKAFCCADSDCTAPSVCDPLGDTGTLGVCREPGSCKPAGSSCSVAADCCSKECHVDHCH